MNKKTQNNLNKEKLLYRFNQKSIRDLKNLLNDYLYNLGISLNLKRKSDIEGALSLIDYKQYENLKKSYINKQELNIYLSNLCNQITTLLNEEQFKDSKSYYWKSTSLIISGKIYLLIKLYSDPEYNNQIDSKLILLSETEKPFYLLKTLNPYYNSLLSSSKGMTDYTLYYLSLDDKKETFYISKQKTLPTYPYIDQIKFIEIEPYLSLSILGCFNELLSNLNSHKFLYKAPYKQCITLQEQTQTSLSSSRWIKPMSQTLRFPCKFSKQLDSLSTSYYTYDSPTNLETYNWINIYY